jgi:hypothetical protein
LPHSRHITFLHIPPRVSEVDTKTTPPDPFHGGDGGDASMNGGNQGVANGGDGGDGAVTGGSGGAFGWGTAIGGGTANQGVAGANG